MRELLDFSFTAPIIVYSILLLIMLLYWFTVIIGVLDFSSFDFDVDVDVDADLDVDVDTDMDVDGSGNIVLAVLGFFNFGKVPFMVVMSILSLSMWIFAVLAHYYSDDTSIWFSIVLIPINLFVSLFITKVLTTPLIPVFALMDKDEAKPIDYIGLLGEVILETSNTQTGQVEIHHENRNLMLSIKAIPEHKGIIKRGSEVVIAYHNEDKTLFFVRPTDF